MNKPKNPQAFPLYRDMDDNDLPSSINRHFLEKTDNGMTLLDYFAAKNMQGIASNEHAMQQIKNIAYKKDVKLVTVIAENSYAVAEAMLKERSKHLTKN